MLFCVISYQITIISLHFPPFYSIFDTFYIIFHYFSSSPSHPPSSSQLILAVGNYLNAGTFRGSAPGFRIDVLSHLDETRSSGSLSLLNYLSNIIEQKWPDCLPNAVRADLFSLEAAKKVNLPAVLSELAELRKGLDGIKVELGHVTEVEGDMFGGVMGRFWVRSDMALRVVEDRAAFAEGGTRGEMMG